ncbi:unnamed protein product [Caenorhabditis angaria]|uniref:Uncharacterized protein n=1 Tax=Caenorhabditis angaria TaxID=860376 RepID=A0A9P1IRC0_9PELO|nr:unnamed protein product [Caenorhabditis angaria]
MAEETSSSSTSSKKKKHMEFTPMTPESTFQYADLNIKHVDKETTLNMVKRAIKMGYDTVAINIDVGDISEYYTEADMLWTPGTTEETLIEPPKKKKKQQKQVEDGLAGLLRKKLIPLPFYVNTEELDLEELTKRGKIFRQFSRITMTANEQIVLNKTFIHPTVLSYDLIAVRPGDPSVLETLSRKTELFDIITIDRLEADRGKWLTFSKVLDRMRNDGIFYEISYAECLISATRKTALFNGRLKLMMDLRAPIDVMNLSMLWGVASNEARKFVSGNPKNLLLQSESRGTENGDICSMKLSEAEEKKPPIEVRMTHLQYNGLLKATKDANELMKKLKMEAQNTNC